MDVDQIRADTPGTQSVTHLLACGSALMPRSVIDAIVDHTRLESEIGGYEAHARHAADFDSLYSLIGNFIGAESTEIAVCENATVGWCQAFYALPLKRGSRILTCQAEYAANYVAFLQRRKRDGVVIDIVPNDASGAVDVNALEDMIDERVGLIAMTWIPTNGGLVNPAARIGAVAARYGIPFLLDACQAIGQMPVNVTELNCDFLAATGRKFLRGPRGTGFLFVRKKWLDSLEPAMIDHFAAPWVAKERYQLRSDARRFDTWENSYALRAGLAAALRYATAVGLEEIRQRAWLLADNMRGLLREIPGCRLHDVGNKQCAIISFTIEGLDPRLTVARLRDLGISIGASGPSSTRLDAEARKLPVMMRAAPHYYNTESEIEGAVAALANLQ